jgi:type 1 glutamine amidotransferase
VVADFLKGARLRAWALAASLAIVACGGGGSGTTGTAGSTGSAGATAGATGAAGSTSSAAGETGSAGSTGAAGTSAAGQTGSAGATGTAGASAAGSTGSAGATAGATGTAGAGGSTGGATGTAGQTGSAGATGTAGSHGNKVLLYTKSTGFVHGSTPIAAMAIAKALTPLGYVGETSADPTKFTPDGLSQYAAVVLIATAGEPFGTPGTTQIKALIDWVHGGGGLIAIENADHAYDNVADFVNLIGGDFNGHSAGNDTCILEGTHPITSHLPATFMVNDEIYYTTKFRMDNQVIVRCGNDKRPIAWVRQEGGGRVFYEALGHNDVQWTTPPLVDSLVVPGILWSMSKPVP